MKRTITSLTLLILPLLGATVFELFILPIDFFMFRSWEALSVNRLHAYLPGPFYPNRRLEKIEQGDLGHHTRFAVQHATIWTTDDYGYRYAGQDRCHAAYDVVIVGNSFVVGTGLNQNETLDRQLQEATKLDCYPYAPRALRDYLSDPRFQTARPTIVIWAPVEPYVPEAQAAANGKRYEFHTSRIPLSWIILADRFTKYAWVNYLQTHGEDAVIHLIERLWLGKQSETPYFSRLANDGSMLFYLNQLSYPSPTNAEMADFAALLKKYETALALQGTRFIFCPVPRKTTVYYQRVPLPRPTDFPRLIAAARAQNIPTIDLLSADWSALEESPALLYQFDDTHWNQHGVALAVRLLARQIRN